MAKNSRFYTLSNVFGTKKKECLIINVFLCIVLRKLMLVVSIS